MKFISVDALRDKYLTTDEFAVIDPREELFFARGHLFAATNMPLSRLELMISVGVPNKNTQIIFCDDGEGQSEKATTRLDELGYQNVQIVQGGLPSWALMGGAVFSGINVPSKAFGEVVERDLKTPSVTSLELTGLLSNNENILLLDARPPEEHEQYCIPGSISCPSGEMVLRTASLENARSKHVIVHCAGRTRSIIGAQTLIDSGLFKSVRSLCNGTPGWEFVGLHTEKGSKRQVARPEFANEDALSSAKSIRAKWSIKELSPDGFTEWKKGSGTRYVFDIRTLEEYEAGHLRGARHIPGGQLLQTIDRHIVVQNSNITLIDNDNVRAVTTAMWLRRMGWRNVCTFTMSRNTANLEVGLAHQFDVDGISSITQDALIEAVEAGTVVVCDLRCCYDYRRWHLAGSAYLNRADLENDARKLPRDKVIVLAGDDPSYSELVRKDLSSYGHNVKVLDGGRSALVEIDLPNDTGYGWLLSRPIDTYFESDHYDDFQVHIREHHAYLNWEIALIDHIVGEPAVKYDLS